MMVGGDSWAGLGSAVASLMFVWAMARQFLPYHLEAYVRKLTTKMASFFYPYIEITFAEFTGERLKRSEAYAAIEAYLGGSSSERARRLKAEMGGDGNALVLSMDDYEEVADEFRGAKVWWSSNKTSSKAAGFSFYPAPEDRRYYRLIFHRAHRRLVHGEYLRYVVEEGKAIGVRRRQRKLFTNSSSTDSYDFRKKPWSHVPFEHPATFDTLAMEPDKKREIIQDLVAFSKGKDYYSRIGKPWKRGYLLYGPPGTGKSTMIAAMANLLDYDVYDLELTAVKNNTCLRRLLIETTPKSIIVMEDIDCSLKLTGKRKGDGGEAPAQDTTEEEEEKKKLALGRADNEESKVTLSGLLNFIDGLWSACAGERLIVFTTNHVEKLDPALIRRGRMDKHVELSHCGFEAFKVLARNYLGVEAHPLFESIQRLMEEVDISPADVAENLMPKNAFAATDENVEACLGSLVQTLKESKSKSEEEEGSTKKVEVKESHCAQ